MFLAQWNEGETAAQKAQLLLEASGIKPSVSAPAVGFNEEQSAVKTDSVLPQELQGFFVFARLDIEALNIHLPVLRDLTGEALKASVCYYLGPNPGCNGNLVITGHNYRNGAHFGRLDKLVIGDIISLTDIKGDTYTYTVYKLEHIKPDDVEALYKTQYERELSLLTCEANGNGRLLVRCCIDDKRDNKLKR